MVDTDAMTELFKCAGPSCPGYPYRASEHAHPASCNGPTVAQLAAPIDAAFERLRESGDVPALGQLARVRAPIEPPNNDKLCAAASALERLAADLRGEAEEEERNPPDDHCDVIAPGLRRKADWLDEVAEFLDDLQARRAP